MKLGVFTSCLHDRDLTETIEVCADLGLTSLELNVGGFFPDYHLHTSALRISQHARDQVIAQVADAGMEITAFNCSGNPLHPDREVGPRHAAELLQAIDLAPQLEVPLIVVQTGNPGAEPGSGTPSWVVSPWDSSYSDVLDYQWELATAFWKEAGARATANGVKLAVEMHPHQLVYNPPTLERLIDAVGEDSIGCEMDPSHLFWQGIDPIGVIERFGDRVFISAAKDTLIHEENLRRNGFLNNLWPRNEGPNRLGIGGRYSVNDYPVDASYEFVAVGRGHDVTFWGEWLGALNRINPDMAVNVEHEDVSLERVDGLALNVENLRKAAEHGAVAFETR